MLENWILDGLKKLGLVVAGGSSPVLTYFGVKFLLQKFTKNGNSNVNAVEQIQCEVRREKIEKLVREENTKQDKRVETIVDNQNRIFQEIKGDLGYIKGRIKGGG